MRPLGPGSSLRYGRDDNLYLSFDLRQPMAEKHTITGVAQLEALYGAPAKGSIIKETDRLTPAYRAMIAASPFVVVATSGAGGLDCSPRGDAAGWVRIVDDRTLMLPDRRGNNRVDTLRNIVEDGRIGLLFLIPGKGETLRVNGTARVSVEPDLLASFAVDGKPPRSVIVVAVGAVYFQCARAIMRSALWEPRAAFDAAALPTAGRMTVEAGAEKAADFDEAAYTRELPARQKATLY